MSAEARDGLTEKNDNTAEEPTTLSEGSEDENLDEDEYEEEEDDEDEEPKLKYERIGNSFQEILAEDAASCMTVHPKVSDIDCVWCFYPFLMRNGK